MMFYFFSFVGYIQVPDPATVTKLLTDPSGTTRLDGQIHCLWTDSDDACK
jgi:hypothetical protein